jgi:hypothetical protein
MLILLDDVWEQDIVDRFTKLYDNDCRYLVTTRDEAVYEIAEAEKVEISKDDIKRISKGILLYHSLLTAEELPVCFIIKCFAKFICLILLNLIYACSSLSFMEHPRV